MNNVKYRNKKINIVFDQKAVSLGEVDCNPTQVGADPASPGRYAARVAQLEMQVRILCEQSRRVCSTNRCAA